MSDPALLSIIQARKLPARELIQACRARIDQWQSRTNAFLGFEEGPVTGVPLAHKDVFCRAGRVSSGGSKILRDGVQSDTSAALARLDAAGFADLGRLNMSEFAYGTTGHNEHFGDCCNPWNPDYIAGGSSSGSGAAVAARIVFGSLGTDTGGSVRLPAAACGVTGLKTTWGRVSRHGVMPLSPSLDTIGPIARSAEDCALLLQAIAGFDPRDPVSSRVPAPDYPIKKHDRVRIAISSAWIERHTDPEVGTAVLAAAKLLASTGARLTEVEAPDFDTLSAHCLVVMQSEASAQHLRWMRERPGDYSSAVRARLELGYAIPATVYLEVLRARGLWLDHFCNQTLGGADLYLLPGIAVRLPTREQTGSNGGPDVPRRVQEVTRLARWVNYLGVPALVVPCGFDSRGLPLSLQLVGRPFSEPALLASGHAFQQESGWHKRVPAHGPARNGESTWAS